jgi:hypothetical protein
VAKARKKRRSRARIGCGGCGAKLKARAVPCAKCGTRRPGGVAESGYAGKAMFLPADGATPFLVKAARPRCPNPHCGAVSTYAGARHCTSCGTVLGLRVVKSAGDARSEVFLRDMYASPDPGQRESLWRAAHPQIYGNGGQSAC